MVVGGQTGIGQQVCLLLRQHSKRAAGFHPERANTAHHLQDVAEPGIFRNVSPCGAHAESCGALRFGACGCRESFSNVEEILCGESGVVVRRLRAIRAIFGTAARLHA